MKALLLALVFNTVFSSPAYGAADARSFGMLLIVLSRVPRVVLATTTGNTPAVTTHKMTTASKPTATLKTNITRAPSNVTNATNTTNLTTNITPAPSKVTTVSLPTTLKTSIRPTLASSTVISEPNSTIRDVNTSSTSSASSTTGNHTITQNPVSLYNTIPPNEPSAGLSGGEIAAISVCSVLAGIAVVAGAIILFVKKPCRKTGVSPEKENEQGNSFRLQDHENSEKIDHLQIDKEKV